MLFCNLLLLIIAKYFSFFSIPFIINIVITKMLLFINDYLLLHVKFVFKFQSKI